MGAAVFPLGEVHRGLRGVAYTVFEGVRPEPMAVEILGVLKDALGPGRDLILGRLSGTKPEYTGVVAGMSGSPVYIDGRLVGALSYRIGQFSKEPIAGITPIEQMLEVRDGASGVSGGEAAGGGGRPAGQPGGQMGIEAMETPLVFGGYSPEVVERFGDRFRAVGLTPVAGLGGRDAKAVQTEPLVPGSAVSAVLVEGDLSMTGTCTVTYVDPTRLLACGHPITQYGPVEMPMTKAEVVATLPSPLNAFKIVNATETVGSFTEDRASAILGRFGQTARMISVSVEVRRAGAGAPKVFHFRVLDNRELTPQAMLVSVYQTLQETNVATAEMSYRMTGELLVSRRAGEDGRAGEDLPPVRMEAMLAPSEVNSGAIGAALFVNDRFSRVYGSLAEQPVIRGLRMEVEAIPERRSAVISGARLGRTEARAGEVLEVEANLRPFRSAERVERVGIRLPESLQPGTVRVLVSDGATLDRLVMRSGSGLGSGLGAGRDVGLAGTVGQINRMHPNDRVYVTILDHAAQAVLDSAAMEEVPLSMVNVLQPLREAQKLQLTGESALEMGSVATGYAVSGSEVLTLTVR